MQYVPAEPGWLVKFSDGSTAPVVAWAMFLCDNHAQALPITTENAGFQSYDLISPAGLHSHVAAGLPYVWPSGIQV